MNLKSIQRNYAELTALERMSLLDNAISRDDETEIRAVVAASPRRTFSQPDYLDLFEQVNKTRFISLITRIGYVMQFELLLRCDDDGDDDRAVDNARLTAYLYVRVSDAWQTVCDELCLRPDYDADVRHIFLAVEILKQKDAFLRATAFSETEAAEFLKKKNPDAELQTLESEIKAFRDFLDLPTE